MQRRIEQIIKAAVEMTKGEYHVRIPVSGHDELARLGEILNQLGDIIEKKFREITALSKVTEKINAGIVLEEVLNYTYESFRPIIPYNRIGFALLEEEGTVLRAHWARSDTKDVQIYKGYTAPMKGSSLQKIITTGRPRIINDLKLYLKEHPTSVSTQKIVAEGIRSNLTCPLVAAGKPIGFIFFSSTRPNTYRDAHVELFSQIAGQLSMIVEKSRLYQQLLELNDLKNTFLGLAVHDLRSPISLINSRLDLIMDGYLGELTDKQKELLKGIRQWCARMLHLVEDLLDVSAIESGKLHLKIEKVALKPYLEECVAFNRDLAAARSIRLEFHCADDLGAVEMDPHRVHQVLNNLIANAVKYSPVQTQVTLAAQKYNDRVQISLQDQGQGILKEELSKIFDYFGAGASAGGESGTGLGLAISKKMVEAHGGRIWVESDGSRGATFHFTLPLKFQ
ncbi:MAG: GAF domain-containing protein [Candidatus Omnitrophica bacterium]|nr:GAF domain-containing protein [Candidatus Omnitrophota bacterium]